MRTWLRVFGIIIAIVLVSYVLFAILLQRLQTNLQQRAEKSAREIEERLDASVDRNKCGPEHLYYFRMHDLVLSAPAIQIPGLIWPRTAAFGTPYGYDRHRRVLCGNSMATAPQVRQFNITLKFDLVGYGSSRIGAILEALSKTNVRRITISEGSGRDRGLPYCGGTPHSTIRADGKPVVEMSHYNPKADYTSYFVSARSAAALQPKWRSVKVWRSPSSQWGFASFSNCYELPVDVGGDLRDPLGDYAQWQELVDQLVQEMTGYNSNN